MREIKFRAWDKEDKKLWKVVSITESVWGDCEEAHIRVCELHENPSKKETDVRMSVEYELMQYTGLKDKNGKEIFEGDILKTSSVSGKGYIITTIEWSEFSWKEKLIYSPIHQFYEYFDFSDETGVDSEVIGNIYENPELLEDSYYE